jgi:hypothetical protein
VWEVGMRHEAGIKAKLHALIGVHKEDAESLYKWMKDIAGAVYTDYDKNGYGLKYRVINVWFKPYIDEVN